MNIRSVFKSFLTLLPNFLLFFSNLIDLFLVLALTLSSGFSVGGMNTINCFLFGEPLEGVAFPVGFCLVIAGSSSNASAFVEPPAPRVIL